MSSKAATSALVGFPPIAAKNARVLILGSMPSKMSLQRQQYYGHQRNAFWLIMGELFGAVPELDYQSRKNILLENNIAVWDVLKTCRRMGSMDTDIELSSIETNDFVSFFGRHPLIKTVYFNGGTAEKIYKQRILASVAKLFDYIHYQRLPSTSPAYASMPLARKIVSWQVIALK